MSYVIRDPLGPALSLYARNKRFRHRMLKYWPTKIVDGIKVFDKLVVWQKGVGVLQDENRLKIYKLIDMTVADLEANDYTGLDRAYLQIPALEPTFSLTDAEIEQYLADNSPRIYPENVNVFSSDPATLATDNYNPDPYQNNPAYVDIVDNNGDLPDGTLPEPQWDTYGWITDYVVYQPEHLVDINYSDKVTDTQIINFVKEGNPKYVSINGLKYASPIFFAALKDVNEVLYEKKYTIIKKELAKKTTIRRNVMRNSTTATHSTLTTKAIVKVEYRRVKDPTDSSVQSLINDLQGFLSDLNTPSYSNSNRHTINEKIEDSLNKKDNTSKQIKDMYYRIQGYNSANVNYGEYVRYDELDILTAKEFTKVFVTLIDFAYDETPATFWEKVTSIIITVVAIIVVAVLLYLGPETYWAIPLVLSAGALAQGALARYWAGQGKYAAATYAGKQAQFLANSAEVSGYVVAFYQEAWLSLVLMGIGKILEESHASGDLVMAFKVVSIIILAFSGKVDTKQAAGIATKEATKKVTAETVKEIVAETIDEIEEMTIEQVIDTVIDNLSTTAIANALNSFSVNDWISLLNLTFQYYTNYINPPAQSDEMVQKVAAQEKQLETLDGPETVDTAERQFSDPYDNYIDGNSRLQRVPADMTHGLNAALMNKYYNSGY